MKLTLQDKAPAKTISTNASNDNLNGWMKELDGYYQEMQDFKNCEPDEIFMSLSAWTSRASHMRSMIHRSQSKIQQAFRTKQVDPFIDECDRQFKIWSRVFSVQTLDWNMQRGQT